MTKIYDKLNGLTQINCILKISF